MSGEHVCEWERHISPNYDPPPYIRCKHCKEPMETTEILAHLSEYETLKRATDALSAEDAREAGDDLDFAGLSDANVVNALYAYADILEGK